MTGRPVESLAFRLVHWRTRHALSSVFSTPYEAIRFLRFASPHTMTEYVIVPAVEWPLPDDRPTEDAQ